MKNWLFLTIALIFSSLAQSQSTWQHLPSAPTGGRWDDVFFIDSLHGWTAGSSGKIFQTKDAGASWAQVYNGNEYFRCIEFYDTLRGYAGTLNKKFLRTTDGGQTWTNIISLMSPKPEAVCGISLPDSLVGYAVGEWDSPAFLLKTDDGGLTWTSKNMSAYANALVDVFFMSADTGFVTGKSDAGATILYTTDGGATWTERFNGGIAGQYVWKIQRVTPQFWVGSIQTFGGGKFAKSSDGGMTWQTQPAPVPDMQGIGFATPQRGWIGGYVGGFWETSDGGANWTFVQLGGNYNRFQFLSPSLAYASGASIYKFSPQTVEDEEPEMPIKPVAKDEFWFKIEPNPMHGKIRVRFYLPVADIVRMDILSAQGASLRHIYHRRLGPGEYELEADCGDLPAGQYLLGVQRNHGLYARVVVKM